MSARLDLPPIKQFWRAGVIGAVIVFVYATVLVKLGSDWWTDENYSHGLLVPFVVGYILWSQRRRFVSATRKPAAVAGLALVSLALLTLWAGTAGAELFMQRA